MELNKRELIPYSAIRRKVGNGMNTRFLKDLWCGDRTLEARFPRMVVLASNRNACVSEYWSSQGWNINWRREIRGGVELSQHSQLMSCIQIMRINLDQDAWQSKFGDEESFTVRYVRYGLDVSRLPFASIVTRWCKILPIKVNVFVWRALLNRLPTRTSLDHRVIDIESLLCPCCNNNVEDSNHVFFTCNVALELWNKIAFLLDLHIPEFVNMADMFQ